MSNEDANPALTLINPQNGTEKLWEFFFGGSRTTPWGGGFDDMAFGGGKVYIDASNPTAPAPSTPVLYVYDLTAALPACADFDPAIPGTPCQFPALTVELTDGQAGTTLSDADSMFWQPTTGLLMIDSQSDGVMLFYDTATHTASSVLPLATQIDDTVFANHVRDRLLVSDTNGGAAGTGVVYEIKAQFVVGSAYSATAADSGVPGVVGNMDLVIGKNGTSSTYHPIAIGLASPHGEAFITHDE
jgi:hypothetical protein